MNERMDLIIVGAGPAGLACAIEACKMNLRYCVIEKGSVVNSVFHYPTNMTFFTTAELLEIGDVPLIISSDKPKRVDALKYYRRVVEHYRLDVRVYEEVESLRGEDGDFLVQTRDRKGIDRTYHARKVIIATGYYDNPNKLGIPGEQLAKVSHYYTDAHPYFQKKVMVVGGNNSAAEAALELYRNGAEATLVHRGPAMGKAIKYWVLPDINNRISQGEIRALFSSRLKEIREEEVVVETPEGEKVIENDFVLALTGYHPDPQWLAAMGVIVNAETYIPCHDPETLETNVKGLFLAGSVVSGKLTNRVFIENGRFHGAQIFKHWNFDAEGRLAEE
jgi:thioredoxin reductase (NADPH)